ncbi:response regulator transcription factor [Kutzneria sp. CA-103260]|uniref:response regulator transcription factor n=1 Tax=Kutzneria sp. CA-103260 TaxID=2802641 RepID=UPI001BACB5E6|nr:response regulator transcription factor [Kutzneria sp. CA-103260]QUQ70780.1 response regulator transcription factor [Kutzneria sp. CA-103260]
MERGLGPVRSAEVEPPLVYGQGQQLLVVDDEPGITEMLATTLGLAGYQVRTAGTGREALKRVAADPPDLVILDVMLPDVDGFEVCRRVSELPDSPPVLLLTARDSVLDKVTGLTTGADDYLTKPFSIPEVLARVQVLLRRARRDAPDPVLSVGGVVMDEGSRRVTRDGRLVELSPTEYRLLRYLMVNAGRVVSKAQVLEQVWRHDFGDGVVEKVVSRLRQKLDATGAPLIHTVRGFGYSLREG